MSECHECGKHFSPAVSHARFCGANCRRQFNNRRATRGAELYDYYMSSRFQRKTHGGAIAVMNQMASNWRDTDKRERGGRQSWVTPDLSDNPVAK